MNELTSKFERLTMDNTPPISESGRDNVGMSVRVFGGKFADLRAGPIVKHNIHDHPAVVNICSAYASVEIVDLSVFASVYAGAMSESVKVYLAWGHCEHAQPVNAGSLAQLPNFIIYHFAQGNITSSADSGLDCAFTNSISKFLKPIQLYGGRPSLYAMAEAINDEGKVVPGPLVQLFFKITVRTAGSDIIII